LRSKLIIFDLDGTIIDVYGCGRKALDRTMAEMYKIVGISDEINLSKTDYGVIIYLLNKYNLEGIFFKRIDEFYSIYSKELKIEIKNYKNSRLMPGFPEILEYLKNNPFNYLALATGNMKIGAITKMNYFKLDKYFPVGGYGDKLLTKKDVILNGYINAIEYYKTSFKKVNVFVIADTAGDINAAKELGFNSIAVKTGFDDNEKLIQSEPDWIFNDFSNLEEFEGILKN